MSAQSGNTWEPLLNQALAQRLRELGLEAQAEQSVRDPTGRRHQVDVLVELDDDAIAIEAEFAPAATVRADARKRLPVRPVVWRGLPVRSVFTVIYPESLQHIPESLAGENLAQCETLTFCQGVRRDDGAGGQRTLFNDPDGDTIWRTPQTGSPRALADLLHDFWIRTSEAITIEATVEKASRAIATASEILARAPTMRGDEDSDPPATCALIWLNALLFQELLAKDLSPEALPPPHRGQQIPRPRGEEKPSDLLRQWDTILAINWWPIFHVARETLADIPSPLDVNALDILKPCARSMAEDRVIRRHDVAGRIFHRLLDSRKFLATNYTTIPAAVLLAGLAFDEAAPGWTGVRWGDPGSVGRLRIVDPACGSGTLLMAAVQEILKRSRRAETNAENQSETIRTMLEQALLGFDVVPSAIHLTAATLSMAETRQVVSDLPLFWMPHDVDKGVARLGSLDFLARAPNYARVQAQDLYARADRDAGRTTGEGKRKHDAQIPKVCDLIISNPPYTRAGGPGSRAHTDWNPLFGSVLSEDDAQQMKTALRKTLNGTPASLYAGLGSAFVTLAHEHVGVGGRLAFVLPAAVLTGSRWGPIRALLLDNYDVEWVVVSHDLRHRAARAGLPGRLWVAFSESTRMGETLVVATRRANGARPEGWTQFVNLRRNPDEPIEAIGITQALLANNTNRSRTRSPVECRAIDTSQDEWGEVVAVRQRTLGARSWAHATFIQSRLVTTAVALRDEGALGRSKVPTCALSEICALGPYHMQVKNPKQGLFDIIETSDPTAMGEPALWHHSGRRIVTLGTSANARLRARRDRDVEKQEDMLAQAGQLHVAGELRHAPQRLAAVCTDEPMLGVRSWITLNVTTPRDGTEEALCLWLNSTAGFLLRLIHANRPYLGRTGLPHELARTLPVLDTRALKERQLKAARDLFCAMEQRPLRGFAEMAEDPIRRELDRRLLGEVLEINELRTVGEIAQALAREPLLSVRH